MTAFDQTRQVEARGMAILTPFLKTRSHDGRLVLTSKGRLARHLQETIGDALFNSDAETIWSVEIKVEEEDRHGNFFLETWSNKNLSDKFSHAQRGSNPGWLLKLQADLLFYYFAASDELYIIDLFALKRWAFTVNEDGHPTIDRYREKLQGKRTQLNDTWGRCVPIVDIMKALPGTRKVFPRQIELFGEEAA